MPGHLRETSVPPLPSRCSMSQSASERQSALVCMGLIDGFCCAEGIAGASGGGINRALGNSPHLIWRILRPAVLH